MIFYSHKRPDKLLKLHLHEVCDVACRDVKYKEEVHIASFMHDFGKYTSFFQEYLDTRVEKSINRHGFVSAIAAAYVCMKTTGDAGCALDVYSCVLHHHGNLRSIDHNLPRRRGMINELHDAALMAKIRNTYSQLEDMRKNLDIITAEYEEAGYSKLLAEFITSGNIENLLVELKNEKSRNRQDYLKHQYIYSRLIYADKLSASNTWVPEEKYFSFDSLNNEKDKICSGGNGINVIRNEIFNSVQDTLAQNWNRYEVFTITAPTGTGKTYSGFFAALRLKELAGLSGKLIYSLPFTSIINQNYHRLKKLYSNCGASGDSYILMHHHLGDASYKNSGKMPGVEENEKEDYTAMQAQLLIESWSSGVVITTFVQLVETLIGVRNKMLKKFCSLENSIILIDEIQSIDIKYHRIIEELLTCAIKKLSCKVILMTATKPVIFSNAKELLDDYRKYYSLFNRTRLLIDLTPVTCDEFVQRFLENYDERKSYLIVCNTIRQSLDIYYKLILSGNLDSDLLYYLSTNIIPKQREQVITDINKILKASGSNKKPVLVSTQVVEAGVDMDFDEVYRDIAPLDSIIQCAGRCNRNGYDTVKDNTGNVHLVNMELDDKSTSYASMVYRPNWLNLTIELLKDKQLIEERDYLDIINAFFESIKQNTSDVEYQIYKKAIEELDFDVIGEFSLINNKGGYIDVFVNIDDEAEEVFRLFHDAMGIKDVDKRREMLLNIKRRIQQHIISVPIKHRTRLAETPFIFFLPREACADNGDYSPKTGFNRVDNIDQFF